MDIIVNIISKLQTNILFWQGHRYALVVNAMQLSRVNFELFDNIYLNLKNFTFDILKKSSIRMQLFQKLIDFIITK